MYAVLPNPCPARNLCVEHLLTNAVGKTLAYTNIKFTNPAGDIVARGSHTKYV